MNNSASSASSSSNSLVITPAGSSSCSSSSGLTSQSQLQHVSQQQHTVSTSSVQHQPLPPPPLQNYTKAYHSSHPFQGHPHHPHHHLLQHHNVISFSTSSSAPSTALSMSKAYQAQISSLDDQGIDMSQSPGRESPSSTASSNAGSGSNSSAVGSVGSGSNGCRNSTSSFDSGRASSTIYQQGVRYSGLSSESSSGSFRHSYHSSSSSLGSIAPEEICTFDVAAMIAQGIPDHETLNTWLTGIRFEMYYQNFIQAGYDMHTISRMTPEDLNAIGVTKPNHRKRLKAEISQLNISDGLPDYIPNSIEEWLCLLKLDEYAAKLHGQGYHSVRQVTNITWEDLEDFGVLKLGHQKKFMLAIKRIEDILAGKRIPSANSQSTYAAPESVFRRPQVNISNGSTPGTTQYGPSLVNAVPGSLPQQQYHTNIYSNLRASSNPLQSASQQQQQPLQQLWRQNSLSNSTSSSTSSLVYSHPPPPPHATLTHQPQLHHVYENPSQAGVTSAPSSNPTPTTSFYPDVVTIQVNNGRRNSSVDNISPEEPIYGTLSSFLPTSNQAQCSQQPQNHYSSGLDSKGGIRFGSATKFEEGDVTPTNETAMCFGSGVSSGSLTTSTLPRLLKKKPIAQVMGGGINNHGNPLVQDHCLPPSSVQPQEEEILVQHPCYADGYKSLPRDIGRKSGMNFYGSSSAASGGESDYGCSTKITLGKANSFRGGPPPPPRRGSCSSMDRTSMYASGQQVLSSFGGGVQHPAHFTRLSRSLSTNSGTAQTMPPPPPTISCDQFTTISSAPPSTTTSSIRVNCEMLALSKPDDSVLNAGRPTGVSVTNTNSHEDCFRKPGDSGGRSENSSASLLSNSFSNSQTVKFNAANSSAHYLNRVISSSNGKSVSSHPAPSNSMTKPRDSSPVGNDFSDFELRGGGRNGSDASFKSNSSTESESFPFANDNAGTIKQQKSSNRTQNMGSSATTNSDLVIAGNQGSSDVLNDIGNMLADLTDELDAILEQEIQSKR